MQVNRQIEVRCVFSSNGSPASTTKLRIHDSQRFFSRDDIKEGNPDSITEKSILLSEKRVLAGCGERVTLHSGAVRHREQNAGSTVSEFPRHPSTTVIMKFCPNYGCVAYGRMVYTQSTRCVFCRWDLKPPRMKSETAGDNTSRPGTAAEAPAGVDSRAQHRRTTLRHSA
jgi:hypothetical protein